MGCKTKMPFNKDTIWQKTTTEMFMLLTAEHEIAHTPELKPCIVQTLPSVAIPQQYSSAVAQLCLAAPAATSTIMLTFPPRAGSV
jgi:hypothetical protein